MYAFVSAFLSVRNCYEKDEIYFFIATPESTLDIPSRTRGDRHNLVNNYLSAMLIAFIHAGLIEALVELGSKRINDEAEAR